MALKPDKPNWKEVTTGVLERALSTGHAHMLSSNDMPTWAQDTQAVTAAWLYTEAADLVESTGALSTGHIHGRLLVERQHLESPRFRYDQYLLVRVANGRVFQLGPYKDVECGHHHDQRPSCLDGFRSESTG